MQNYEDFNFKNSAPKMTKEDVARRMNSWRERDNEKVTGVFKNYEAPGQSTSFVFAAYPGEEFTTYFFQDGEKYTIPRGVARHLNTSCYTQEYKHLPNQAGTFGIREAMDGKVTDHNGMTATKKVYRYGFLSLEFQDEELDFMPDKIIQVTEDISPASIKKSIK